MKNCNCNDCKCEINVIEVKTTGLCEDCESGDDFCSKCGATLYDYVKHGKKRICKDCFDSFNNLLAEIKTSLDEAVNNFDLKYLEEVSKIRTNIEYIKCDAAKLIRSI